MWLASFFNPDKEIIVVIQGGNLDLVKKIIGKRVV